MVIRRMAMLVLLIVCTCVLSTTAWCGRNSDGALIIHTDPSTTYTAGYDYCDQDYLNPGNCISANTQVDSDLEGEAVIVWALASFPAGSSPGVTVVEFGIDHTVSSGNIVSYGPCGPNVIEIPDPNFPGSDSGMTVAFYPSVYKSLFPFYWFAVYGRSGDTFGTSENPATGNASFVDEGNPPQTDYIYRFGYARWGSPGDNDCPPSVERREATLGEIKSGYRR